jgi:hypothetical protein
VRWAVAITSVLIKICLVITLSSFASATLFELVRYLANNGAAFAESMLRVIFGYEPSWLGGTDPTGPTLPNASRGLQGSLSCIRGPSGAYLTATLAESGVDYVWGPTCDD